MNPVADCIHLNEQSLGVAFNRTEGKFWETKVANYITETGRSLSYMEATFETRYTAAEHKST
ncbi:hypothetical protein KGM_207152 [Danaus plexippus plexippus]|uniref:Uncharacterized protein n=1 Tax=Danaus plexippus plexippus TaxID=278856 RepID=A0A212FMF7_DANPL|nr:hypothetical protein KGM_207152 [Danaus plexippus plexippus]